jgi:putative colanic acid biosynthesis UDP-glucose lipid carrier transferase
LRLKRCFDLVIALALFILLAPFFLLIACAIRIDSPGPSLFWQPRNGQRQKPFLIVKFRTMTCHRQLETVSQCFREDSRVTRVGAFLRYTSIDELPQIWNVIVGEMSLVGPRPHPIALDESCEQVVSNFLQRYAVKPGITGLAQVRGLRGALVDSDDVKRRLSSDLEYIENWTFVLDLQILLASLPIILGQTHGRSIRKVSLKASNQSRQ